MFLLGSFKSVVRAKRDPARRRVGWARGAGITCSEAHAHGEGAGRRRGAVGGADGAWLARLRSAFPQLTALRRRRGGVFCKGCLALSNMEETPALAGVTCERD